MPTLVHLNKEDSSMMFKLFCFATSEQPATRTWTHDGDEFIKHYSKIYRMFGRRLEKLTITKDWVDWKNG
eukprot:7154958-Lingulodinium_polyedra.AAC.1